MKPLFMALFWRLIIGLFIALLGVILAFSIRDMQIEYTWFSSLGFVCMFLAAIPFMPGARRGEFRANWALRKYKRFSESSRQSLNSTTNFAITMALIGGVNLVITIVVFYLAK